MRIYAKVALLVLNVLLLNVFPALADERICPPPKSLASGADELRMHETEFTFQRALDALTFLQKDIYEIIKDNDERTYKLIQETKVPKDTPLSLLSVLSNERFYISYPNSLAIINGTLLKYRLLYLNEKMNNPSVPKKAIRIEYEKAKAEFCEFVAQAKFVD